MVAASNVIYYVKGNPANGFIFNEEQFVELFETLAPDAQSKVMVYELTPQYILRSSYP